MFNTVYPKREASRWSGQALGSEILKGKGQTEESDRFQTVPIRREMGFFHCAVDEGQRPKEYETKAGEERALGGNSGR